ncbi:MAG: isochorismatase family protein [Bacillota bacterium]
MDEKYVLQADNCLLLVIDIQAGTLLDVMPRKELMLRNSGVLIKAAQTMGIPVVVTEHYPKGLGPTAREIVEILPDNALIWEKITFDACTEEFLNAIQAFGRKQVLVVGMEAHVCAFLTPRGLLHKGYQVHIVSDAVESRNPDHRHNALSQIRDMGAVITNTETVFFDLVKVAGTPIFKQLLPLIK